MLDILQTADEIHVTPEAGIPALPARRLRLIELYKSVQGESSFAGLPCIFVRLAGCNLRCSWCDSEYTFTGGQPFTREEILEQIVALQPCRLIEFTGGEPMLQARELLPLFDHLLSLDYELLMETSGERLLADVPRAVRKVVDVKCPGSGMGQTFRLENLDTLSTRDEIKFVLLDRTDYEFARDFIQLHALGSRCGQVLLSPAFRKNPSDERSTENMVLDPRELVAWMLEDGLPARLNLQIHKFIWEPRKKGV